MRPSARSTAHPACLTRRAVSRQASRLLHVVCRTETSDVPWLQTQTVLRTLALTFISICACAHCEHLMTRPGNLHLVLHFAAVSCRGMSLHTSVLHAAQCVRAGSTACLYCLTCLYCLMLVEVHCGLLAIMCCINICGLWYILLHVRLLGGVHRLSTSGTLTVTAPKD